MENIDKNLGAKPETLENYSSLGGPNKKVYKLPDGTMSIPMTPEEYGQEMRDAADRMS